MELCCAELHHDGPEEQGMREHPGVLYTKGGYTTKEGTVVCLVLYRGTYMMLRHAACYLT